MKCRGIVLFAVLLIAYLSAGQAQGDKRKGPIVRQVDRILIESGDPGSLFRIFSTDLMLPEAWPLTENQGYTSGGVSTGNATIEFYHYATSRRNPADKDRTARYAGLALEPYPLEKALRELKISGIPYGAPEPFMSTLPDGKRGVQYTTVPLPSFSRAGMSIFLYEYSPAFLKVDIRRKQFGNRLTLNNGGPLGIQSLREIVIGSQNFARDHAAWKRLLGTPTAAGNWNAGGGPAIRLVKGNEDRIQEIAFAVKSLDVAKTFLERKQWLGITTANELFLNASKIQTLKIRLTP
jgi:hypothetical protein